MLSTEKYRTTLALPGELQVKTGSELNGERGTYPASLFRKSKKPISINF